MLGYVLTPAKLQITQAPKTKKQRRSTPINREWIAGRNNLKLQNNKIPSRAEAEGLTEF